VAGLIGPNGSGKSTFLNLVSRIYDPSDGVVRFDGRDMRSLRPYEVPAHGIARTFQNVRLFKSMTVRENLLVGSVSRTKAGFLDSALALPAVRREEQASGARVAELAAMLGISQYLETIAADLPYGLQKIVELGRALAAEPKLLLLDEPVAGLNSGEKENFLHVLRRLRAVRELSIMLVEHDMAVVMAICEVVYVLDFGRLIGQGSPAEVQENPRVIEAYLGVEADDAQNR
jgi:branched-chain amino acid transport system ATP-binding protein